MSDDVVSDGKFVSITYTLDDPSGQLIEQHDLPVGYIHGGEAQLLGGMDQAIAGHRAGEVVELTIPADQAFGPRDDNLIFTDDLDNVPAEFRHIGAEVLMQSDRGESRTFYVTRIEGSKLTVDGNHPLAGRDLKVTVRIHEVRDARPGDDKVSGLDVMNMAGPTSIN